MAVATPLSKVSIKLGHQDVFHLAVLCDSLRCGAYGTFCYGISRNVSSWVIKIVSRNSAQRQAPSMGEVVIGEIWLPRGFSDAYILFAPLLSISTACTCQATPSLQPPPPPPSPCKRCLSYPWLILLMLSKAVYSVTKLQYWRCPQCGTLAWLTPPRHACDMVNPLVWLGLGSCIACADAMHVQVYWS